MFILDTNVVSELRKAKTGKADANVVAWAAAQDPAALFLSAITLLELEMGVRLAEPGWPTESFRPSLAVCCL